MRNNLKISTIAVLAALLLTGTASAVTVTVGGNGGLLNLGGGSGNTVDAGVNTGGGSGNDATLDVNLNDPNAHTVALDLGNTLSDGGTTATVDLGGTDRPTSANVNLGGAGGTNGNVLLDLFGDGTDGTNAQVALNTGNSGVGGVGTDPVVLDLFGPGDDGAGGANGTNGSDGSGGANGSNGGSGNMTISSAGFRAVAARADGKCFAPNATQIDKLASRHVYGDATPNGWAGASRLRVIDVGLCKSAGVAIAGDANVDRLQSLVAGNAGLKASLGKSGRTPNDVIAVDKSGQTLTVYVM